MVVCIEVILLIDKSSNERPEKAAQPAIYLASKSPRRREMLEQIGVPYEPLVVTVDERRSDGETPEDYVVRLAREKAAAGAALMLARGLVVRPVLGADTLVICDGEVMEKPANQQQAATMLRRLSGREHQVLTAIAFNDGGRRDERLGQTRVRFRALSDTEIRAYWQTGEPRDKAGAYGIQGKGAVFVESIEGSYSNVVGLPIEQLFVSLQSFDIDVWQSE